MFGQKQLFDNDVELLDSQAEYKKPFIYYVTSSTLLSLGFKLFAAYLLSLIMISFGLFENFAIFIAYFTIEVIMYNLNNASFRP